MGTTGKARLTPNLGVYQVSYELKGTYKVSVAAPSKETLAYIKKQITPHLTGEGYKIKTEYLLAERLEKNILNRAKGDYIFWAGEHISIPEDALIKLLSLCVPKQNGIAGAKVLDRKKRVLSNGYIYDREGNLIPSLKGLYGEFKGYFLHGVIPKWVSAVSFTCVVVKRKAFEMAEEDLRFTGEYYGADLSFSMRKAGFFTVVSPEVSVILKSGEMAFSPGEREMFSGKWEKDLSKPDPCYNRNLKLKTGHTYEMRD